ncbi:LacI family DNA-binding transcriptional regulator [Lapidilactobacillus bayanensis]|uniref:LacI family DNA-binding transcriptional regulator n=1 Tax=Lapidilactobacillus bayanensis TaxID=2485998 RepID=UPI000F790FC6|nr:LacI family DNA-binding transcriptional regulator [Lapidilactobacillus bayanensis]
MITLKDIARLSGYSVTTVSRALNGHSDVNDDTKKHIKRIAEKYGYSPNILAQGLVSKDSKTFGFITSNFGQTSPMENFTFPLFMKSIEEANLLGYEIVMIHYNSQVHRTKTYQQLISERNLSGAIVQGFDKDDELCQQALKSDIPTVFIDIGLSNETTGYVVSDIAHAADLGMRFLLQCSYQNLLFIYGSNESWVTGQWKKGVNQALEKYRDSFASVELMSSDYTMSTTQMMVQDQYSKLKKDRLAVFAASDVMAIGAMRTLQEKGLNIPEDVGILGYDGMTVAQYVSPALTTIAQSPQKLGAQAIRLLIELASHKTTAFPHSYHNVDVELIVRDSTRLLSHD